MDNNDNPGLDRAIAMAILDCASLEKLPLEKAGALMKLYSIIRTYQQEGVSETTIIRPIIMKKIAFIKAATTKAQLQEILKPPKVHYTGGEIRAVGSYAIPEEELILWSRTSLHGPLISAAVKRYQDLFREVFPELANEIGIEGD